MLGLMKTDSPGLTTDPIPPRGPRTSPTIAYRSVPVTADTRAVGSEGPVGESPQAPITAPPAARAEVRRNRRRLISAFSSFGSEGRSSILNLPNQPGFHPSPLPPPTTSTNEVTHSYHGAVRSDVRFESVYQGLDSELQRLDQLIGEWAFEDPDGNEMGSEVCEWLGTGFVQCEAAFTPPEGAPIRLLSVLGYDETMERFTWVRYWNNGLIDDHIGWLGDEIWRWVQRDSAGGRFRLTQTWESPSAYSFQWEESIDGQDWEPTLAGRSTKVG